MTIFKKKTEGEKETRDWSMFLPVVMLLMIISAVVGIGVGISNFNSNNKIRTINEYIDSTVVFSVVGYGSYQGDADTARTEGIVEAYDKAYAEALEKASLIAANTGNNWRITKVEEVESVWDKESCNATSTVRMSFAVAKGE